VVAAASATSAAASSGSATSGTARVSSTVTSRSPTPSPVTAPTTAATAVAVPAGAPVTPSARSAASVVLILTKAVDGVVDTLHPTQPGMASSGAFGGYSQPLVDAWEDE